MALDNDGTSDNGYMKCKLGGSFVGEYLCIPISLVQWRWFLLILQVSLEVKNTFYTFRCTVILFSLLV